MAEKRIKWIDIARAFFIIAIVIGHTFSNPISNIRWFVFAFHVPAWFFLSGLCLNIESDEKITTYIKKKIRTIVLPYVLMSLLSIFVFFIAGKIIPRINTIVDSPLSNLKALLYSNSNQFSMRYNLPLWFLPCLFTTEVIGFSLEKIGKKLNLKLGVRIFAVMIAIVSSAWLSVYLPWHIETAISMLFWYELGIITQEYWSSFKHGSVVRSAKGHFVATVALIIMGGWITFHNVHNVAVRRDAYGILWNYYVAAILLILGFCLLAQQIGQNKCLEYIGRNSLGILLFHKFPMLVFQELIPFTKQYMDIGDTPASVAIGVAVVIISLIVSLIATEICKRIFPPLLGLKWQYKKRNL